MNAEQFAYWMQGFVELHGAPPTEAQWASIKEHLALVFTKVTPEQPGVGPDWLRARLKTSRSLDTELFC